MIRVEHVSYTYGTGTKALDDVSVEFPRGTISAVLGESGSGKTTLLMCLGQFLRPQEGRITHDDRDLHDMPEKQFRQAVGIVFQKLYLFPHLSVLENMVLAPVHALGVSPRQAREDAQATLERLSIPDLGDSYPSQISGGQAQRVAIARGLLLKPDYMLLDEPTSALDHGTTEDFANWLKHLQKETNFVIVTHDILFAQAVAAVGVSVAEGRILRSGNIDEIIAGLGISTTIGGPAAEA